VQKPELAGKTLKAMARNMKRMENKILKVAALILLSLALLAPLMFVQPAQSQTPLQTVVIRADGTIDPASTPIQQVGDKYVVTGDIYGLITIEKSNVLLDGAGYTLQGTYNGTGPGGWMIGQGPPKPSDNTSTWTIGVDFSAATKPQNVTVENLNIKGFYVGMYVWVSNNTAEGNSVTGNIIGVLLSGDSNNIIKNYIAGNDEGLFLGVNGPGTVPLNITLSGNSFVDNEVQFSGCTCAQYNLTEAIHTWDNGSRGNFWSDYNGTDSNGDGIGDTPYVIDPKNQDRFPLMQISAVPPASPSPSATSEPSQPFLNSAYALAIFAAAFVAITAAVVLISKRRKKKQV